MTRRAVDKPRTLAAHIRLLLRYREMLFLWTSRELRARYRQSVFGIGWALIQPVFQMLILTIVFGRFIQVPSEGLPYPVFIYTALLPWTLFATSIGSAIPSIVGNMQLVTKIYFPREILPLSAILTRIVDFFIASIVLVVLMIWHGISWHSTFFYVPVLLLIQTSLALGISLLGASVSVFIRDISFALPLAMQLWMYASPVIYPISAVPERWRSLYMLNPMAGIIDSYRRVMLWGKPPDLAYLGAAAAVAIALCLISYVYFKKLEMSMSDVM